ncbi:hypothetical protein [Acrocarpospora sp. B8E8]|uniref:hypothetical protein n=1 Tax=Acrocarpospora sp. B8E8 TaxID=3153572 RepID=UPI00325E9612
MREKEPAAVETRGIAEHAQKSAVAAHHTLDEVYDQMSMFKYDVGVQFKRVTDNQWTHTGSFIEVNNKLNQHSDRLGRIEVTQKEHTEHFGRIDGRLDSMDGRLDSMDGRLDSMDERLDRVEGNQIAANKLLQTILDEIRAK